MCLPWLSALVVFVGRGGLVEPGCAVTSVSLFGGNVLGGFGGRYDLGACMLG